MCEAKEVVNSDGDGLQPLTKPDTRIATLDKTESDLALAIQSQPREDLERDAIALKELEDVYEERGRLTKEKENFVKAAALYNAATLRTKKSGFKHELAVRMRNNELAFCKVVGVTPSKLPFDFRADVASRLHSLRENVSDLSKTLLQELNVNLVLDSPTYDRVKFEETFIGDARVLCGNVCSGVIELFQCLLAWSKEILGPPPQEYAVLGLGSLARGETTPYSDVEWCILVHDDTTNTEYFRNLTRMVHFFVLNVGETLLKSLYIKSLNDYENKEKFWFEDVVSPRGFAFDSAAPYAGNTPLGKIGIELIRTPERMAQLCEATFAEDEGNNIDRIMATTVKIDGSEKSDELVKEYTAIANKFRREQAAREKAFKEIQELIYDYGIRLDFHEEFKTVHDVKQDMYRLPTLAFNLFKAVFSLSQNNTWSIIEEMNMTGKLTDEGKHNLQFVLSIVTLLRQVSYSAKSCQNELISIQAPRQGAVSTETSHLNEAAIHRYYLTMLPFVKYFYLLDVDKALGEGCILESFFENNTFMIGRVEFVRMDFQSARKHFFSYLTKSWVAYSEQPGENVNEFIKTSLCHDGQDLHVSSKDARSVVCLEYISRSYLEEGHFDLAQHFAQTGLRLCENDLEESLFQTAVFQHVLGTICQKKGDIDYAIQYYFRTHELLSTYISNDGTNKSLKLILYTILNNIASAYLQKGESDAALGVLEMCFPDDDWTKIELNHPKSTTVAATLHNTASVYIGKKDFDNALPYALKALSIYENLHRGNDHPHLAWAIGNLGDICVSKGMTKEGLVYYSESLSMLNRVYSGRDSLAIACFANDISARLLDNNVLDGALKYAKAALEMMTRLFENQDHLKIIEVMNNLGDIYFRRDEPVLALEHYVGSTEMHSRLLGNDGNIERLAMIGNLCIQTGNLEMALKFANKALDLTSHIHEGKAHRDIVIKLANVGYIYLKMQKFDDALKYYLKAVQMAETVHSGREHLDIARCFEYTGDVWLKKFEFETALECFGEALVVLRRLHNDRDHLDTAKCLKKIGSAYAEKGSFDDGLKYLTEARIMAERLINAGYDEKTAAFLQELNKFHSFVTSSLQCASNNEAGVSVNYFTELLDTARRSGQNYESEQTIFLLDHVAAMFMKQRKFNSAIKYAVESLDMKEKLSTSKEGVDKRILISLNEIGRLYVQKGDFSSACKFFTRALDVAKAMPNGGDPNEVRTILNNLSSTSKKMGNAECAAKSATDQTARKVTPDCAEQRLRRYRETIRCQVPEFTVKHWKS